jgi:hypothetical protein
LHSFCVVNFSVKLKKKINWIYMHFKHNLKK